MFKDVDVQEDVGSTGTKNLLGRDWLWSPATAVAKIYFLRSIWFYFVNFLSSVIFQAFSSLGS